MSADPQAVAERAAASMWARDRASSALGMALLAVGPGRARMAMTVRPEMCNGHGTCHGGLIFTLADSAFAFACNSHDRATVANNCTIAFVAPAREGDRLTAEAEESHRGRRSGICEVRVTDQSGRLIALFRGHSTEVGGSIASRPS